MKVLENNNLIRSVVTVATGTIAAQIITIFFVPVITRLYGPDAFGLLGVFIAVTAIMSPVAALTYPVAIILPKKDTVALRLAALCVITAALLALVSFFFLFFVGEWLSSKFKLEELGWLLLLTPVFMFFSALYQINKQWMIRKGDFRSISVVAALQAFLLNGAKVCVGMLLPAGAVLVIAATLGQVLHSTLLRLAMTKKGEWLELHHFELKSIKNIAIEYRDFPLYRAPQALLNAISQSLPILIMAVLFGPVSAGFFALVKSMLGVPALLLGQSVSDVFYPRFVGIIRDGKSGRRPLVKACLALTGIGIAPCVTVFFLGPWLFGTIFGEEWHSAGEYASWMVFWYFSVFITRPVISAIPALSLQAEFLVFEATALAIRGGALYLGYMLLSSEIGAVMFFSISNVFLYAVVMFYVVGKS